MDTQIITQCPRCQRKPFEYFLRGQVVRPKRFLWFLGPIRPYCAIICRNCKNVVGYEMPEA